MKWRSGHDPFERAFRARYVEIVRLGARILGDTAAAEDVAQETFSRLAGHEVLQRDDEQIAAWLRRVALNAAFNARRGERRRDDRERRSAARERPDADHPLSSALRREEQAAVRTALAGLPERQRLCLVLRHSGYSYREIAAAADLAIGSVGVTLARAESAFRVRYESDDVPEVSHESVS